MFKMVREYIFEKLPVSVTEHQEKKEKRCTLSELKKQIKQL